MPFAHALDQHIEIENTVEPPTAKVGAVKNHRKGWPGGSPGQMCRECAHRIGQRPSDFRRDQRCQGAAHSTTNSSRGPVRSEEHTSELQSLMRISYAVFCLKKKNNIESTQQYNPNTKYRQTT